TLRAHFQQRFSALHRANASADLAGKAFADHLYQFKVAALAHGRIKIDQLNQGKTREAPDPIIKIIKLQRLLLTVDELYDLASHQVNGWDQHGHLMGMPARSSVCFRSAMACVPK